MPMAMTPKFSSRPTVVLDKDFLQGSSTKRIQELAVTHELLMSDALFYELTSTDQIARARIFAKLGTSENPVSFVGHGGILLNYEMAHRRPSGKPSEHRIDIRYRFNTRLKTVDYEFPASAKEAIEEEAKNLVVDVENYLERVRTVPMFAPSMAAQGSMARIAAQTEVVHELATDREAVLRIYRSLSTHGEGMSLPDADMLDESWALYRRLQVQLLFAVDTYARYGDQLPDVLTPAMFRKFEHDVLDQEAVLLGVLEGSFATRENKLQRMFSLLIPNGTLFA